MATTTESMADITCLCAHICYERIHVVHMVVHMKVFDPGQRSSFSLLLSTYNFGWCLRWSVEWLCWPRGFWMQGANVTFLWTHNVFCSVSLSLLHFLSSSFAFFPSRLISSIYSLCLNPSHFPTAAIQTLSLPRVFWCRGTAEPGRKRWSWGWSCATMASCITVQHFFSAEDFNSAIKKKKEKSGI